MFKKLTIALALLCAHNAVYSMEQLKKELKDWGDNCERVCCLGCFCREPRNQEDLKTLQAIRLCAACSTSSQISKLIKTNYVTTEEKSAHAILLSNVFDMCACALCACYYKALDERVKRVAPDIAKMH